MNFLVSLWLKYDDTNTQNLLDYSVSEIKMKYSNKKKAENNKKIHHLEEAEANYELLTSDESLMKIIEE